uniref:Uncharacterized protein n=1 Tax=Tanacetum cinerariifolium TaxID=118510 RepID=A0A6L2NGE4_TANCI|nr:hypothetical protein [Tanacetum cinerariifolium]
MKRSLQDLADNIDFWEVLRRKFENSSVTHTSCRIDTFRGIYHNEHQEDDASPKGEKRAKRYKSSKRSKSARGSSSKQVSDVDEVIHEDESPETKNIRRPGPHAKVFYSPQRNPNEPPRYLYNKDLFFLKHGNTEERSYILSLHKINVVPFPEDDLEEKLKDGLEKNSRLSTKKHGYQFKIRKIHGIREDKPGTGLIYLNSKEEKRVMYLAKIVKFCNATLERVLNEVKLRIFNIKFLKKAPLLEEKMGIFCKWKTNSTDNEASVIINP